MIQQPWKRRLTRIGLAAVIAGTSLAVAPAQNSTGLSVDGERKARLRGTPPAGAPAEDIFSDGGIEEANRDEGAIVSITQGRPAPPLSDPSQGRAAREPRVIDPDLQEAGIIDPRANRAVDPVETGTARIAEDSPFAAQGMRIGSWSAFLTGNQSLGVSSNTSRAAGGESGTVSISQGSVLMRSNWSRHEATLEASGSLQRTIGRDDSDIPALDAAAGLRLDLADGLVARLRGSWRHTTESTSSDQLGGGVAERPGVNAWLGSASLEQTSTRLQGSLQFSANRTVYENAQLTGGGILDQSDRDNTVYRITARTGYAISPALTPFVEAGLGRRLYDSDLDRNGDERDSTIYDLRGGAVVDLGEKLRGESSVGYLMEDFDGALASVDTVSFNADLVWSPVRDTQVRFTAATAINGSTSARDSGSVVRSLGLSVERQASDRLALRSYAQLDSETPQSSGSRQDKWLVGAGFTYWINRFLGLTGKVEHERLQSGEAAREWQANTVSLGVTLQR